MLGRRMVSPPLPLMGRKNLHVGQRAAVPACVNDSVSNHIDISVQTSEVGRAGRKKIPYDPIGQPQIIYVITLVCLKANVPPKVRESPAKT